MALAIVFLSLAIAACVGLLVAGRLSGTPAPVPPAGSVSQVDQQPTTAGCEAARQWGRC